MCSPLLPSLVHNRHSAYSEHLRHARRCTSMGLILTFRLPAPPSPPPQLRTLPSAEASAQGEATSLPRSVCSSDPRTETPPPHRPSGMAKAGLLRVSAPLQRWVGGWIWQSGQGALPSASCFVNHTGCLRRAFQVPNAAQTSSLIFPPWGESPDLPLYGGETKARAGTWSRPTSPVLTVLPTAWSWGFERISIPPGTGHRALPAPE